MSNTDIEAKRLESWFGANDIPLTGEPHLTLIAGGRSNLTYRVHDTAGREYVLRRPPRAAVLQSAHDVSREHRVITALRHTDIPVPVSFGLCTDESVIGAPFYVMNSVPGAVVANDVDGARYPYASRRSASTNLVDVLADIHLLDVDSIGLGELGPKQNYCRRQLKRWSGQFHAADMRDLPLVDELHDRLARTVPPQRFTGLVHGDYRPGNILLNHAGQIAAVLDWELTTLGDTIADLGWMIANWRQPGEAELLESPTAQPGWLSRDELIERYQARTGRDVSDIGWYQAFALWRLTCIAEGIYARYRAGGMGDDGFDIQEQGRLVLRLAEASHNALNSLA